MKLIQATIENLETVSVLFDLYRQFYKQTSDLLSARNFLSERILKKESVIYLAIDEETGEGIGFVQLFPAFSSVSMKRLWILNDLFVHKDHRKKGIAEALIERSKELARNTNAKGLMLETHNQNFNAQKLYDKTGFVREQEYLRYYFIFV